MVLPRLPAHPRAERSEQPDIGEGEAEDDDEHQQEDLEQETPRTWSMERRKAIRENPVSPAFAVAPLSEDVPFSELRKHRIPQIYSADNES